MNVFDSDSGTTVRLALRDLADLPGAARRREAAWNLLAEAGGEGGGGCRRLECEIEAIRAVLRDGNAHGLDACAEAQRQRRWHTDDRRARTAGRLTHRELHTWTCPVCQPGLVAAGAPALRCVLHGGDPLKQPTNDSVAGFKRRDSA